MSYDYKRERHSVFTEDGVRRVIRMRTKALELIGIAGAVRADKVLESSGGGSSFHALAALDYLVETGDLVAIPMREGSWAQHQVYVTGEKQA